MKPILTSLLSLMTLIITASFAHSAPINLATGGTATQSSTLVQSGQTFEASRAIDGLTNGDYFNSGLITHTDSLPTSTSFPWWQVDLGSTNYLIDQIVIWGRTDISRSFGQLSDFTVSILNTSGTTVWTQHYQAFNQTTSAGVGIAPYNGSPYSSGMEISLSSSQPVFGEIVRVMNGVGAGNGYLALAEVQVFGQSTTTAATPEPGTVILMGLGALGLAVMRRRRLASTN